MNITNLFNKPRIIGVVADADEGKSNLIYHIITELKKDFKFKLYAYGLRNNIDSVITINSIQELEQIRDSIIIIEELSSLFDLDNRKLRRQIENSIRLVFHNNNVIVFSGLGENYKKFLSAKLHCIIFKKVTFADLINGSKVKNVIMDYSGDGRGYTIMNIPKDEAVVYDGEHYETIKIPYLKQYDLKAKNVPIIVQKK